MRNKLLLIAGAVMLLPAGIIAAPISPQEALNRLSKTNAQRLPMKNVSAAKLVHTFTSEKNEPTSYIFNGDNQFIILSADDKTFPVIGYGQGEVNPNEMPVNMVAWMNEYGRQIEYLRKLNIDASEATPYSLENAAAIKPLMTSKWNQDGPYNSMCPIYDGSECVTGCVATAMAQVMNYFKYPEVGEGSLQYTANFLGRKLSLNFSKTPFDWDNILDTYYKGMYTDEQAEAVGYLMKACGYAVRMDYSPSVSGTQTFYIADAARSYFKYDSNTVGRFRDPYPTSEWTQMVYDNLMNVGPVVMGGDAPTGGHCFVCDGYDGNGYFHFNWGWGGISDGYYVLDMLTPSVIGIGGYEGGFNYNQEAIFGMQPATGEPTITQPSILYQYGYTTGSLNGNNIIFNTEGATGMGLLGWGSGCDFTISVNVGAVFQSVDNENEKIEVKGKFGDREKITLPLGTYYPTSMGKPTVEIPNLANGKYKVTLSSKDTYDSNSQWTPVAVKWSYPNYVYLTVDNGKYTIENVTAPSIKAIDGQILSPLYFNKYVKISASFINDNDIEITRNVTPILYEGNTPRLTGDGLVITMLPGENTVREWITKFVGVNGYKVTADKEFTLHLYDTGNNYDYGEYGKVTMMPQPNNGAPTLSGVDIPEATKGSYENGDINYPLVYFVPGYEFTANISYRVKTGFFDGVIDAGIYESDPANQSTLIPVQYPIFEDRPLIAGDTSNTIVLPVIFNEGDPGKVYHLVTRYNSQGRGYTNLSSTRFMVGSTGITILENDNDAEVEYYNLQGIRIPAPIKGQVVIEKRGNETRKILR